MTAPQLALTLALTLAAIFGLIALLFFSASRSALNEPQHYDGIGGKDTNNLVIGCLGPFVGMAFGAASIICLIVAGIVAIL